MKLTTLVAASALVALTANSDAFSFDFSSIPAGTVLPPSVILNVAGYGDVRVSPVFGSVLEVDTNYNSGGTPTKGLEFDVGDVIQVDFLGAQVFDVNYDFIDLSVGESLQVAANPHDSNSGFMRFIDDPAANPHANGGALVEVTFDVVPEPASSMLGLLGAGLLFLRRRR